MQVMYLNRVGRDVGSRQEGVQVRDFGNIASAILDSEERRASGAVSHSLAKTLNPLTDTLVCSQSRWPDAR
jgi:hypothetical protein